MTMRLESDGSTLRAFAEALADTLAVSPKWQKGRGGIAMTCRRVGACLVLLLLAADPSAVTAPVPEDCTYASCALRIRHRVFSTYLVQEHSEHRVASLGLFPTVPLFAERSDSAARYYAGFRRRPTSGVLLGLAGSVVLATGLLASDGDVGWAWTLAGSP